MRGRDPAPAAEQEHCGFDNDGGGAAPGRILIVEDDYLVATEIEATLADAGFHVVGMASSAYQAIRLARTQHPDVAVVDVRLVGAGDGIDAAVIMFNELGVRCIFASAQDDPDTRERARQASPIAWLGKPYPPARLIPLIHGALSSRPR
jgi:DNA-binding NarL/FixJ family response regulator